VVEEVVVVEKRLMLVEEIHVTRRPVPQMTEIPVSLRTERATVEREDAASTAEAAE
jgi:stress response protein YsnF